MTKPVLRGSTGVIQPTYTSDRTRKSDITVHGVPLSPTFAFTMETNQTTGLRTIGAIRLWEVLPSAPWVREHGYATVYPHENNPTGANNILDFMHAVALGDGSGRAVVLYRHGNDGTTTWRYYACVVTLVVPTDGTAPYVSVGSPVEVLVPSAVQANLGWSFFDWDGTTEGAYNWAPSHTINGLVELTGDGFVVFLTLTYTDGTSFERTKTVLVARRFLLQGGSSIGNVAGDAGKWRHVWSDGNHPVRLWTRDIARLLPSGQYAVALGSANQDHVLIVIIAADLPLVTASSNPAAVNAFSNATDPNGRDRVVRLAKTGSATISAIMSNESLAPNRMSAYSMEIDPTSGGTVSNTGAAHSTDLYSWGYWEASDAANAAVASGQLMAWSVSGGLRVATVGVPAQGGLEEADAAPLDPGLFSTDYWNSHFVVMPGGNVAVMRLTDSFGEYHQYFVYDIGAAAPQRSFSLRQKQPRMFFDRVV